MPAARRRGNLDNPAALLREAVRRFILPADAAPFRRAPSA
jgi:hypothetical protein